MKDLYAIVGISKQALHQHSQRQLSAIACQEEIIGQANAIRQRHPAMGCRTLHNLLINVSLGRDKTEQFLLANGYRLKRKVNFVRTTVRQRIFDFPNLIRGRTVNGINQVWQTDITYFILEDRKVFYLVFIIDVYSRRILGYTAHDHMRAEANLKALLMAFKNRRGYPLKDLIHHSDHGSQYIDSHYREALTSRQIQISMGNQAWQNAYTERLNGTIKNGYLYSRNITCLKSLRRNLNLDVYAYNTEKPHGNLPERMSPMKFEQYLKTAKSNKYEVQIFNHED
jgi:putative transposase